MDTKLLIDFMVIVSLTLVLYWVVQIVYCIVLEVVGAVIGFIKRMKGVELEEKRTKIQLINDNDNKKDVNKYAGNEIRIGGNSNNSGPVVDRKHKKAEILIPENLNESEKDALRQFYDL